MTQLKRSRMPNVGKSKFRPNIISPVAERSGVTMKAEQPPMRRSSVRLLAMYSRLASAFVFFAIASISVRYRSGE